MESPDRCLARVVKIEQIDQIPNSTNLELAQVLGWKVIVQKNEFKVGDLCIYFSVDCILDRNSNTEFLEGKPLKARKILGIISQGLIGPLDWFSPYGDPKDLHEGQDVTELMRVIKYVPFDEQYQYKGDNKEPFPNFVRKTDEERIQNIPKVLSEISGRKVIITRKEDGSSATYCYNNNKFYICGRNFSWIKKDKSNESYFTINEKFCIEKKMIQMGRNMAIQGEIIGPKINKNKLGLKSIDFRVFNIWDVDTQKYLPWDQVVQICNQLKLNMVPVINEQIAPLWSVDQLIDMAETIYYQPNVLAEGLVIKTEEEPRISFKVISPKYLI